MGIKLRSAMGSQCNGCDLRAPGRAGEEIADHYGLLLPDTFPSGHYTILVGLHDPVTGQRLPVSAGPTSYAIEVGPIEVR